MATRSLSVVGFSGHGALVCWWQLQFSAWETWAYLLFFSMVVASSRHGSASASGSGIDVVPRMALGDGEFGPLPFGAICSFIFGFILPFLHVLVV
ncbi:hypothetical protein GOP47_0013584 [Adiantum capillus-veneris]|uniref:Uncharacterized protein n=1 Tax=Adiantum capillus-veneris TaxID=13818 RepID=A0A9D4ZDC9_ADICA|nr:hypothetical protein GOP47_0013584 [Adiantum capillus-veneris]